MNITNLTIPTSSLCNLHCSYCFINKNLKKEEVIEMEDLFTHFLKCELLERIENNILEYQNVNTLEFWGGEPTLGFELITNDNFHILYDVLNKLPLINNIFFSTNLAYDNVVNNIQKLINVLNRYNDRKFKVEIQVSCDGVAEINDKNRGLGTTNKILSNIKKFKNILIPSNVVISLYTKPTISLENMEWYTDINNVYLFWDFFRDNFYYQLYPNINIHLSAPNCEIPAEYTKAHGIMFNKILENFFQIDNDKYPFNISVPYYNKIKNKNNNIFTPNIKPIKGGFCGQCYNSMILLPENNYSICHRTIHDIYPAYHNIKLKHQNLSMVNNNKRENFVGNKIFYDNKCNLMSSYYKNASLDIFATTYNYCKILLQSNLISECYNDDELLRTHINMFVRIFPTCMAINYEETYSMFAYPLENILLFFNGALNTLYENKINTERSNL